MAARVPLGMERRGSARSPDMETPASKPVTAGKKMAKRVARGTAVAAAAACRWGAGGPGPVRAPMMMEPTERAMAAMMKYWVLMARAVLMNVTAVTTTRAMAPVRRMASGVSR
jgi:hypothetical protein